MAGSFEIFRKYQRSLLVFVAILAMLAFFVLPPFLQMGAGMGGSDPVVASWAGGELRESGMSRAVAMRTVLNQFLLDAVAASGRDPGRTRLLPDSEEDVMRTLLLAREAEANGVVVSNAAINDFLSDWTQNMVRPEQFEALIARRRGGPFSVSQADLFEALRTVLAAGRMERLFLTGFAGDPPGQRWDLFRRLEQQATVEVVPVPVESVAGGIAPPPEAALRGFFEQYKNELPVDRSTTPGFKEPHRITSNYLVARKERFEAEALGQVTDDEVKKYYDENKDTLYKVVAPAADAPPAADAKPADTKPAETTPAETKPADAKPAETKPADAKPAAEPKPADAKPAEPKAWVPRTPRVIPAAFRKPDDEPSADAKPADAKPADAKPADAKPATAPTADAPAAAEAAKPEPTYEPLEKVAPDIRKRLAATAAGRRVDAVFAAVTSDLARYAEDLALWQARVSPAAAKPSPPDLDKIAEKQGLDAGRLERVTALEAIDAGGVATSFEFAVDPESPMGFRQVGWVDRMFDPSAQLLRPMTSRDVAGDRFLSWKTDDFPAYAPEFEKVRADVERAWRIVEGRDLARRQAEELVKQAGDKPLAEAVAKRPEPKEGETKLAAATVGPFTWLSRGDGPFGSAPTLSEPQGLSMPGREFMEAVFGLEPGGTAVAFNDPKTVCYAIRLVSYAPDEKTLRDQFMDARADQRRLTAISRQQEGEAVGRWIGDLERRYALQWKRPPRR